MEKIKSLLNPGHTADDEKLYGSNPKGSTAEAPAQGHSTTADSSSPSGATGQVSQTQPTAFGQKDHGALGQDTNPNSEKFDDTRFGTGNATSVLDPAAHGGSGTYGSSNQPSTYGDTSSTSQPMHQSSSVAPTSGLGAEEGFGGASALHNRDHTSSTARGDDLPTVPATGGRFLDNQTLGPSSTTSGSQGLSGDRSFPLAGGQSSGTTTGIQGTSGLSGSGASSNPSSGSHIGRDATAVGGAGLAGVGATEAWKRHEASKTASTNPANQSIQSSVTSANTSSGNHGREGLAAAAAAAITHDHSHGGVGHQFHGDPCSPPPPGEPSAGPIHHGGPHSTETANRLDPNIPDTIRHMPGAFPRGDSQHGNVPTTQSHVAGEKSYGHDAAAVGGLGAAGLGAYEADKHHDSKATSGTSATGTSGDALGPASSTAGPHKSNAMNVLDPRVKPDSNTLRGETGTGSSVVGSGINHPDNEIESRGPTNSKDSHFGRDAALVGGAGALGAGAYGAHKHHEQGQAGNFGNEKNPYSSTSIDPRVDSSRGTTGTTGLASNAPTSTSTTGKDHHYGRDAAVVGGTGAAGLGAYEANKHHEDKSAPPATKAGAPGMTGTALGESTGANKHDQNLEKDNDKHHYGRDAAAVGGAGVLGAGGYEAYKHHENQQNVPSSTTSSGPYGQSTGASSAGYPSQTAGTPSAGYPSTQTTSTTQQPSSQHHLGRDAALVGGTGAAGAGAYEAAKHHHHSSDLTSSAADQPVAGTKSSQLDNTGTFIGTDPAYATAPIAKENEAIEQKRHLTGTDPTTSTHDSHKGRDAAAIGATGIAGAGAAHEYSAHHNADRDEKAKHQEAHHDKHADEKKPGFFSKLLHRHKDKDSSSHDSAHDKHSKHEKEAIAGAGATGAGAAAYEHEHHKHDKREKQLTTDPAYSTSPIPAAEKEGRYSHGLEGDKTHHGHGKEALTGAGVAGAGAAEYEHHEHGHDHHERNRLHKDPPAGYAANSKQTEHGGQGIVTDPHTGLPVNIGAYGDGHGGTDGNSNIHGLHSGHSNIQGEGPDWEAIKKSNTPY